MSRVTCGRRGAGWVGLVCDNTDGISVTRNVCCDLHIMTHGYVETTSPFNPLHAELYPIRHLLALGRSYHIVHVSRIRVK